MTSRPKSIPYPIEAATCIELPESTRDTAAKKTRADEAQLYRAYKLSGTGWWEWEMATNRHMASDELYHIYGLTREATPVITNEIFLDLAHPDDRDYIIGQLQQADSSCKYHYDHRLIRPDGTQIYVRHYVNVERDVSGQVVRIHGTTKEITAEKEATLRLEQAHERLEQIIESIRDGFFVVDRNWKITYWNPTSEHLLRQRKQEIIGRKLWDVFPEARYSRFHVHYRLALMKNRPVQFESFYESLQMWVEVRAFPSAEGLSVFIRDITQRKMEENRRIFLAQASSAVIWECCLNGNRVTVSRDQYRRHFGYDLPSDEVTREHWIGRIHPDDQQRVTGEQKNATASERDFHEFEYRFLKADGSWAQVVDRTYVMRDLAGKPVTLIGALEDVTEERRARQALIESEHSYRQLFHNVPLPTWVYDEETLRFLDVNDAALEHYGYSREEFLSMTLWDIRPPEEYNRLREASEERRRALNWQRKEMGPFIHQHKNGSLLLVEVTISRIHYRGALALLATINDITLKARLQEELIQEKIHRHQAISRATIEAQERERSDIGKELHDNVNQVLTTIKLYIENVRDYPDHRELFLDKGVELAQKAINEIRYLARQLVTPVMNDLGFRATIEELIQQYESLHLFHIRLDWQLAHDLSDKHLRLNLYRIAQELLNNIVKYAKASEVILLLKEEGPELLFRISDNGVGFDEQNTTAGLGLKNIRTRAELYKGSVEVLSSPGRGCSVEIRFPDPNSAPSLQALPDLSSL